jgi:hypothetical protein
MERQYNIHGFLRVRVISDFSDVIDGYDHYLRGFSVEGGEGNFDYEVFDFNKLPTQNVLFESGDFIKIENGVCFPKEKYAIVFKDGKIQEYTEYANRATNLWIQVLLLKRGFSFIHSAGIELNGKGLVIPAFGGAGKTILMSALRLVEGFKFFGDDFVIVSKKGEMYPYPSDFSIYPYHIPLFPELKNLASGNYLRRRVMFKIFYDVKRAINFFGKKIMGLGHPLFRGWLATYVKVPTNQLISEDKIGSPQKIFSGVFLERYNGDEVIIGPINIEELTNRICGILNLEFGEGLYYCSALSAFGFFDLASFQIQQKEAIMGAFSNIQLYRILIPKSMTPEKYCKEMENQLKNVIKNP